MRASERSDYAERIHESIGPLIPLGAPLALFDFPNHRNVGDSAIWLGELDYLKRWHPRSRIVWMSDIRLALARPLPTLPEECVILIHGGGNFGDLWEHHQRLRERLAQHYVSNRLIQLPQSIHFTDKRNLDRSIAAFSRHRDFHLVVRDLPSAETASLIAGDKCYLCPDMALHLPLFPRPVRPRHDILALMRDDKEKKTAGTDRDLPVAESVVVDWRDESHTLSMRLEDGIARLQNLFPNHLQAILPIQRRLFNRLATERVRGGSALLSSGRVVITDRLHAHILCTLMRIPHVVLDNSYGKIANVRSAWSIGTELCETTDTFESAITLAKRMLQ